MKNIALPISIKCYQSFLSLPPSLPSGRTDGRPAAPHSSGIPRWVCMVSSQKWNLLNAIIFDASSRFRSQLTTSFSPRFVYAEGQDVLVDKSLPSYHRQPPCSPPTLQTWPGRSSRVTVRPRPLELERAREVGNCAHQTSIHSIPLRPSVRSSVRVRSSIYRSSTCSPSFCRSNQCRIAPLSPSLIQQQ